MVDSATIIRYRPLEAKPLAKPLDDVAEIIIIAMKLTSIITMKPIDMYMTHLPKVIVAFTDILRPIKAEIKKAKPPAANTSVR
ncbi:hypothetical protein FACS1894218_2870 [Bacilli bacterium]|nr:hypothetical protein FACS1894218_2870 [Bacilli bacterium]